MKANYAQRHNERKEEIREAQLFNWCTNAMHPMTGIRQREDVSVNRLDYIFQKTIGRKLYENQ